MGRILRSCAGKTHRPLIVDVVDPAAIFKGMAHKHERWYREQGFRVDVGALNDEAPPAGGSPPLP